MVGILAENPWSGWGRTRFIQTAAAVPLVLRPQLGSPQRGETVRYKHCRPLGVRVCQEIGMGLSEPWVGGWGRGIRSLV